MRGEGVEEPPEEASHTKISELDPFVGEFGWVDTKIAQDESWDNHGSKEANIPCVNAVMNESSILLQ